MLNDYVYITIIISCNLFLFFLFEIFHESFMKHFILMKNKNNILFTNYCSKKYNKHLYLKLVIEKSYGNVSHSLPTLYKLHNSSYKHSLKKDLGIY